MCVQGAQLSKIFLEPCQVWVLATDLFFFFKKFSCHLHIPRSVVTVKCCFPLFCAKRGALTAAKLTPATQIQCINALTAFTTPIWKKILACEDIAWYSKSKGNLDTEWVDGSPAPKAVLELLVLQKMIRRRKRCAQKCWANMQSLQITICISDEIKSSNRIQKWSYKKKLMIMWFGVKSTKVINWGVL